VPVRRPGQRVADRRAVHVLDAGGPAHLAGRSFGSTLRLGVNTPTLDLVDAPVDITSSLSALISPCITRTSDTTPR
jgi:hypothetical protein